MAGEGYPTHDILSFPDGLDVHTLEFVLSHLASVAMDYGLPTLGNQIDPSRPESIDDFIDQLEQQITNSQREAAEKEASLAMLQGLINFYKEALRQARDA